MDTLLHVGLGNALLATGLALFAALVARRWRRPALVHSLWLLVLLKLLTPPLVHVPLPWPGAPEEGVMAEPAPEGDEPCCPASGALREAEAPAALLEEARPPSDVPAWAPEPAAAWGPSWQAVVLAVWLAGSCAWWAVAGRRQPTDSGFPFTAPRDGEYWCYAAGLRDGRVLTPPAPPNEPLLKLRVDTVPPKIEAHLSRPRAGKMRLDWDVEDENLDLSTLQIEYRPAGQEGWSSSSAPAVAKGVIAWDVGASPAFEARVTVKDKARNEARKIVTFRAPKN